VSGIVSVSVGTPGREPKKLVLLKQVTHKLLQVTVLLFERLQPVDQVSRMNLVRADLSRHSKHSRGRLK
jgi:hypothetical protein